MQACWTPRKRGAGASNRIAALVNEQRAAALQAIRNYGDTRVASWIETTGLVFETLTFAHPKHKKTARRMLETLKVLPVQKTEAAKKQDGNDGS